jgi:hypothetical protein
MPLHRDESVHRIDESVIDAFYIMHLQITLAFHVLNHGDFLSFTISSEVYIELDNEILF